MPIFPVPNWTKASYHRGPAGGARYFGAPRGKGRLHAGCDLLAPVGSPIYAVADGVIKRDPYYFYEDTNALEVVHTGYHGFVLRYGEINRYKTVPGIRAGVRVKEGDLIAYVGRLSSGASMLHLEMYSPEAAAAGVVLTDRGGGRFQRSRYLIDPTAHIDAWRSGSAHPLGDGSQESPSLQSRQRQGAHTAQGGSAAQGSQGPQVSHPATQISQRGNEQSVVHPAQTTELPGALAQQVRADDPPLVQRVPGPLGPVRLHFFLRG